MRTKNETVGKKGTVAEKGKGFGRRWVNGAPTLTTVAASEEKNTEKKRASAPSAQTVTKKSRPLKESPVSGETATESLKKPKNLYGTQSTSVTPEDAVQPAHPAGNVNRLAVVHPHPRDAEGGDQEAYTLTGYMQECHDSIWQTLLKTIDLRAVSRQSRAEATAEIHDMIKEIVNYNGFKLSANEIRIIGKVITDDMLGLGPLEPLIERDDITEIMVNGPKTVYIEVNGLIERAPVIFRDNKHLVAVCQRIAGKVGRRVDESSPMCDARLEDGSRVNIILPPLALDGAILTIRKFQQDRITLDKLIGYGSIDEKMAELIRIISACRINLLVSGGTGSGKTTMLNCLTGYINPRERIITCEDSAELQLQQPHVVRLETCPPNLEGVGEVKMRDLVRNCLRMRPERIIVGEVRGGEAFDLLQAMNTGHDGSMGTVHANTPRDALGRLENMIAMAGLNVPAQMIRKQIASSVNVILHVQRLHDGSRKVMSISEVTGMEGDVITMHDLMYYDIEGEDDNNRVYGTFKHTGLKPRFYDKLRQFNMESRYLELFNDAHWANG